MRKFRGTIVATEKAAEDWPFISIVLVIYARDIDWAQKIAEETIGILEIQRGAYNSMRIDEMVEM